MADRTLVANSSVSSTVSEDVDDFNEAEVFIKPMVISGSDDTITVSAVLNGTDHQLDSTTVSAVDGSDDYSVSLSDVPKINITASNSETFTIDLVGEQR